MRFLPKAPDIGRNTGFLSEIDIFQRKPFGIGLTNVLSQSEDSLILVLDSRWGSGKTTFVKMWAGHLRNEGYPVIYYDAFANDYMADAFTAIAGEVLELASEKLGKEAPPYQGLLKRATSAGKVLLRSGAKVGVKAATLGALSSNDLNDLKSIPEDIANEASSLTDSYICSLLDRHSAEKATIKSFKTTLAKTAKAISEQSSSNLPSLERGDSSSVSTKPEGSKTA